MTFTVYINRDAARSFLLEADARRFIQLDDQARNTDSTVDPDLQQAVEYRIIES
jgi:hypothetical protein